MTQCEIDNWWTFCETTLDPSPWRYNSTTKDIEGYESGLKSWRPVARLYETIFADYYGLFISHVHNEINTILGSLERAEARCSYLEAQRADRDRWKARAEALERAIRRQYSDMTSECCICYTCVNRGSRLDHKHPELFACSGCGKGKPGWQFDEARFTPEKGGPT